MVRVYITGCSDVTLRWLRRLFSGELIPFQLSICLFTVVFLACVASSGVTTSEAPRGKLFLGAPTFLWAPKECQNYNYLSLPPPGTQAIEMTEAKEITCSHVRLSYHSGIKH